MAVVGDGTGQHLIASGYETLRPVFVPTKVIATDGPLCFHYEGCVFKPLDISFAMRC